ncbi:MAG: hypothetical protein R3336_02730 [Phycisphaeraceae bacterium]|nr:hypothetical protein [Phycisphaeraceae bacterium]
MTSHTARFARYGRVYHLKVETADDLRRTLILDEALWIATGAPTDTIHGDAALLDHLDQDDDHRVLVDELRVAIEWTLDCLTDASGLEARSETLQLDAIDTSHNDGRAIHNAARKIVDRRPDDDASVDLTEVRRVIEQVKNQPVSEAGVILPEAADEDDLADFLRDVIATLGGAEHPSGRFGVDEDRLTRFFDAARGYLDWQAAGESDDEDDEGIRCLGDETGAAWDAITAVQEKIESFFAQGRAITIDPAAANRLPPSAEDLAATDFDDPDAVDQLLARAPIAEPGADRPLPLETGVNPVYRDAVRRLRRLAVEPILGADISELTREQWEHLLSTFEGYRRWQEHRVGEEVARLGPSRLETLLNGDYFDRARELLAASRETAFVLDNLRLTEKLILHQAHLMRLANNFVSFPELYDPPRRAMCEMGSLIMDGRRFNLAVRVTDRNAHMAIAKQSNMFVLYVELRRKREDRTMEVAVPVTAGGKGNLDNGKRGVFVDVDGHMWDARVVGVIENPISLREAIVAPFKRLAAVLTGKIEKMTGSAEKKLDAAGTSALTEVTPPADAAATGTPAAGPSASPADQAATAQRGVGGMLVGGSIAVAALGSSAAYVGRMLLQLPWYSLVGGLLAAVLAVIVPMVIIGFLKLRRRDLSGILEGSGWSINARMRLTFAQARVFTQRPDYPGGSMGLPRRRLRRVVTLVVVSAILAAAVAAWIWWLGPTADNTDVRPEPPVSAPAVTPE